MNPRRLTEPVASVTAPGSMAVTRSIGTKIRRRVASSTTMPSTRGGLASTRSADDQVADLADALAVRTEHGQADQPRHEDPVDAHGRRA